MARFLSLLWLAAAVEPECEENALLQARPKEAGRCMGGEVCGSFFNEENCFKHQLGCTWVVNQAAAARAAEGILTTSICQGESFCLAQTEEACKMTEKCLWGPPTEAKKTSACQGGGVCSHQETQEGCQVFALEGCTWSAVPDADKEIAEDILESEPNA